MNLNIEKKLLNKISGLQDESSGIRDIEGSKYFGHEQVRLEGLRRCPVFPKKYKD